MKAKWVAFAGVFFAAGIPYWLVPYNQELPAGVVAIGLAALVIAGAVLAFRGAKLATAIVMPGLAVPAAAMARVIVDVARDSTSHNLWPFEIVFATAIGIAGAFVGALIGWLLARATGRR